jgi:hypothetical protein
MKSTLKGRLQEMTRFFVALLRQNFRFGRM